MQGPTDFRTRQIHLDFHTSEHIPGVGADFDARTFAATLRDAAVNSVTLFARCHHGWAYYPSEITPRHPNLVIDDLLGEMMQACHHLDIATPIYLPVAWDELTSRHHPEWRAMAPDNMPGQYPGVEPSMGNQLTATWHALCLNHAGLLARQISIACEVVTKYRPPALFMDIVKPQECVCGACLESMTAAGLDPQARSDRWAHAWQVISAFISSFSASLHELDPQLRLFFNGGHIFKGQRDMYSHFGQVEIESLPTGGWGYDHFPSSARYAAGLDRPVLGMTGRFHGHWGEFGGFKTRDALTFECCQMLALGAHCSIGDQLHPKGRLDPSTYALVKPAYERIRALEPYSRNAHYLCEVALVSAEAQAGGDPDLYEAAKRTDIAAARILGELQIPFRVVEESDDLAGYRLIVLPDTISVSNSFAAKLAAHVAAGGALLATGRSGLSPDGRDLRLGNGARLRANAIPFETTYMSCGGLDKDLPDTSIVMYEKALAVESGGAEILAAIRPPYFDRRWDRFCSHMHAPEDLDADDLGPGVLLTGSIAQVCYPLFDMYARTGQVHYKYMIRGLIDRIAPNRLVGSEMTSGGRISLMHQHDENRYILHLLYAPTQLRGRAMPTPSGAPGVIEAIEDAPVLNNLRAWVRCEKSPTSVHCAYSGEALPWEFDDTTNYLTLIVPEMHIHAMATING